MTPRHEGETGRPKMVFPPRLDKSAPTKDHDEVARRHRPPNFRNFIEPLARGLAILQAFTPEDRWLGNQEVAARVGLPNATVSRLMKTLTTLGYLELSPQRRKYCLAAPVLGLGYAAVANNRVRELTREHMQAFADRFNVSMMLGERNRLEIVLLEICRSNSSILALRLDQGSRVPIAETALGWALMSAFPDAEREYLFTHMKENYPDRWPVVELNLKRAFSQIASNGYCVSLGVWRSEISTVATPLTAADDSSVLVLGCTSPGPFLPKSRITQEIGPALVVLAKQIGLELPAGAP